MAPQDSDFEATLEAKIRAKRAEMELHQHELNSMQLELGTLQDRAKSPELVGETPQIMDRIQELPGKISVESAAANEARSQMDSAKNTLDNLHTHPPRDPPNTPTQDRSVEDRILYEADKAGAQHKKEADETIENIGHAGEGLEPPEPPTPTPPKDHSPPTVSQVGIPGHDGGPVPEQAHGPDPLLTVALAAGAIHVAGKAAVGAAHAAADAYREAKERDHAQAEKLYDQHLNESEALKTQLKEQHELANKEMKGLALNPDGERKFQENQFHMAAHQMNELYADQDKQRKDHGIDIPERNAELQAKRYADTMQLCEGLVGTDIKLREEKMLQDYAQLQPDQSKVEKFQEQIAASDHSSWIKEQAPLLQRQEFPQIAAQGPSLDTAPPQPQQQQPQQPQQPQQQGPGGGPGL